MNQGMPRAGQPPSGAASLALAVTILVGLLVPAGRAAPASRALRLVVNGRRVACQPAPRILEGATYLPLRATAEALGATLHWDAESKTVYLCLSGRCHRVCVREPESGARIVHGRIVLPLRRVAQLLGCEVTWEKESRVVRVSTPGRKVSGAAPG